MKFFAWMGKKKEVTSAKRRSLVLHEMEEVRTLLARGQRDLAERVEAFVQRGNKQLTSMAERIRYFKRTRSEVLALEAEQRGWQRLLERVEVADMDTAELLREWRDWMREVRRGMVDKGGVFVACGTRQSIDLSLDSSDSPRQQKLLPCLPEEKEKMRMEMVRSELRVRGVIDEGEGVENRVSGIGYRELKTGDGLPEWDQYLGEHLPATARFWEKRVEEAQEKGAHETVVHGLVKHMRAAHGHAKTWQKMQG